MKWFRQFDLKSSRGRERIVLATFALYALILIPAIMLTGYRSAALILVPITVTGLLLGLRAGLLAALLALLLTGLLLGFTGERGWEPLTHNWMVSLVVVIIGAVAGWIGDLLQSLQQQISERQQAEEALRQTKADLETRVQQRTLALEQTLEHLDRYTSRLQTIAELARAIGSVQDIETLLPRVTTLIARQFGFYHVGIFLLDETGEYAVLRAANSEGGQRMLERGHKLKVGETGIVGYVTGTGQIRLAADTGSDAVFFNNPDLPHTRSEMALPLKVRDQVIGALDVQSTQPNAFSEEDVALFTILADQVAIAIDNSRSFAQQAALVELNQQLLAKSEQAVAELNLLTRRLTAEGWQEYLAAQRGSVVIEDQRPDLTPPPQSLPVLAQAATSATPVTVQDENESAIAFPILLRNEVIGTLGLEDVDPNRQWSEDDLAIIREVSEQVALALDNARLIQETGRRSEELAALNRMVTAVASTLDLETTLEIVADELINRFSLGHVGIALFNEERTALVVKADRSRLPGMASSVGTVIPLEGNPSTQQVITTRTTLVIPDAQHDPLTAPVHDLMRQRGVQSIAILPLIAGGEVIGTIGLDIVDPGRTLTPDEIRLAETMVTQVSAAIQNARLYERTEEQARTLARQVNALSLLVESTQAITSTLEFNQVIDTLVHAAARQLNAQTAALAVIEEGSDTLQLVASVGFPEELAHSWSVRVGEGMSGQVAQTGQPLVVDDVNKDGRAKYPSINVAQGLVSYLGVPVSTRGRILGVLSVMTSEQRHFSEEEVSLLSALANQAAAAIDNSRLFAEVRRRLEDLADLNEASRALSATIDLEALPGIIYEQCRQLIPFDAFYVAFYDATRNEIEFPILADGDQITRSGRRPLGEGMIAWVIQHRQPIHLRSLEEERPQTLARFGSERPSASILVMPMIAGDRVMGALSVQSYTPNAFDASHVQVLSTLSNQAAIALQNAQLYLETQQRVAELSTINQISQVISSTLDISTIYQTLSEHIRRALHTDTMQLVLYDEERQLLHYPILIDEGKSLSTEPLPVVGLSGYIVKTREPLLLSGEELEQKRQELGSRVIGSAKTALSYLGVPLLLGEKVIGVLNVQDLNRPNAFDESDQRTLTTIAAQVAVAIQNARLYEETRQRVTELSILNQINAAISSALDLDQVLQLIYEQISRLLENTSFFVALYDADKDEVSFPFAVENNEKRPWTARRGGQGMTEWIIRNRQPVLVKEGADKFNAEHGVQMIGLLARSWMGIPLFLGDQIKGVMAVQHFTKDNAFSEQDLRLFEAIGRQAAIAIQNAQLHQETRQRVTELSILNQINAAISSALDPDQVLQLIYEQISRLIDNTSFYVALYNAEQDEVSFPFAVENNERRSWQARRGGRGLTEWIIRHRQPVLFQHGVEEFLQSVSGAQAIGSPARSWMGIPLLLGEQVRGVMAVQHFTKDEAFAERDLRLFEAIGRQAVIALENARLFQQTEARAEELSLLRNIFLELAQQERDLHSVLEITARRAMELLNADGSGVWLWREPEQEMELVISLQPGGPDLTGRRLKPGEGLVGRAIVENSTQVVDDYRAWPDHAPTFEDVPYFAAMVVPMSWQGRISSALAFTRTQPGRPFTANERSLAELLAGQSVTVIQNARLYQETRQRVVELSILNEINAAISAALDLDQVLELVHTQISRLIESTSFYVALYNEQKNEITFPYYMDHGERKTFPPRPGGQGLTGWIIANRQAVRLGQGEGEFRREHGIVSAARALNRSWMGIPLFLGDQVRGVMAVQHATKDDAFDEQTFHLFEALGRQVIVAIENARLYEEAQTRIQELTSLQAVGIATSSSLDLHQILEGILQSIQGAIVSDVAGVTMYNHETQTITVAAAQGRDADALLGLSFHVHQGLSGWVCQERQPVIVADASQDPRHYKDSEATAWFRSFIAVPILFENWVFGTIFIAHATPGVFSEDQMRFLSIVANQAASALRNVELFAETRRRLEEMEVINQIGQAISATLDLSSLHRTIYEQISRVMDASDFYIVDYNPETGIFSFPFKVEAGIEVADITDPPRSIVPRGDPNERLVDYLLNIRQPILIKNGVNAFCDANHLHPLERDALSWLGVPMAVGEKIVGAIVVHRHDLPNVYSESDRNLLATVAVQAASAIENARLYAEIRRWSAELEQRVEERTLALADANVQLSAERDRLDALYQITRELASSLDLDWVLNRALNLAATTVGATNGSIMLVDLASGNLKYRAALGLSKPLPPGGELTPFKPGVGLAGWVLQERQPVIVDDVTQDARWKVLPGKDVGQSRSVAALPLLLGEEVFGVLMVNHPQVGYFRQEHLRLLNAIANEVTIAIHNAELYSYVSEQAERLGEMLMAREEEASKSRAILESIADGVIVSDPENHIILMNPAAERLFQTRTEIVTGRNVFDLYPADASEARARLRQMMQELVTHGQTGTITASPIRFNIEHRTVSASLAPVTGRNRELLGYVTVFRDVSKEVEAERLKNEFISTVSHELRTPMTSIKGYVDLLLLGAAGGITPAQNDFLRVIKTNTDRLVALVNDLLDISRIESGRIRLEIVPLFLSDLINDVVTSSRTLIEERQQQLITRLEPDLPPILGDKGRIVQILNNLVSNAIKYTRPGGSITITLDRWPGGEFPMLPGEEEPPELPTKPYLYVSVTDTGVGISPEDQTKLFTRFFRADNPLSVEAGGTGLGLAIAKSLVELHGGRIWATSQLGVGSTFSVVLPVYEEETQQPSSEAPEMATESVAPLFTTGGPHHILVVDDEPNIAELISHQLRQVGYDISTATSGPEAIELAQKNHPDLIILDVLMPEMDGFEVLSELKRHTETAFTPVIVLSVLRDGEEKGFALGAADYLTKPIDETALRSAVQRLLAHTNGGEPKQILVVDDDRDITGWLVRSLSASGFSTRAAYNGDEALQMIREAPPHLILLDLKMPGTDGYEVIRQLKGDAVTRNIPIIVITASDLEGERTRIRVLGMGAQQLLSKPFSSDVLIKEIRNLIDGGEK